MKGKSPKSVPERKQDTHKFGGWQGDSRVKKSENPQRREPTVNEIS